MDEIKDVSNPVGRVVVSEEINHFIEAMKALWDSTKTDAPWWKFWKKVNFHVVTNFLISSLDEIIAYVAQLAIPNEDRKATVLKTVSVLYDYIVKEIMPIWLKPFSGRIRTFILDTVVSNAIDFIVSKNKNFEGPVVPKEQMAAQWYTMKVNLLGK